MTFEIDQETLCDYCETLYEGSRNNCEGYKCEEATENYLEDHGITKENPEVKTFKKLRVGDKIYLLEHDLITPRIKVCVVNSLSQMNSDALRFHYESEGVNVPDGKEDSNRAQSFFLYKKDCEKALQELCKSFA